MQSTTKSTHKNIFHAVKDTYKFQGIKGFFVGYSYNVSYNVLLGTAYLGTYGYLRKNLHMFDNKYGNIFMASLIASTVSAPLYPLDTFRVVLQTNNFTFKQTWNKITSEGYTRFYRGWFPAGPMIMSISGLAMMVYEYTKCQIVEI
jgi:hypothetical protein